MPSLFETLRHDASHAYAFLKTHGTQILHHPGHATREALEFGYDKAIGNDVKTLLSHDPKTTRLDRVLAGLSIASDFVGPDGRLIGKTITLLEKGGLEKLESRLGKDAIEVLAGHSGGAAHRLANALAIAEGVIEKIQTAKNVETAVKTTVDDFKQTVHDIDAAIHAAPGDRANAWKKVAADVAQDRTDLENVNAAARAKPVGRTGPAGVGRYHENATPWDGKQTVQGSISWSRDGEVQQHYRGRWISYDANKLGGDPPVEGHAVLIKPDPANPGCASIADPLAREQELTTQRGNSR